MTKEQYLSENAALDAAALLREMISVPSLSGEEHNRAQLLECYLKEKFLNPQRIGNNIICKLRSAQPDSQTAHRPVLLLNSHIDTVKPSSAYSFDPFNPPHSNHIVYGLGSNDAGASVVSLISAFIYFSRSDILPFDLTLLLSAEEENSGKGGINLGLTETGPIDAAIVGEPTQMRCAVAERGLLVLDCTAKGVSGHAARNEGINALYIALEDISRIRGHRFNHVSPMMGDIKMTVTQIEAGSQHNVVPDICRFLVDIRPTDACSNEQIVMELRGLLNSEIKPRSLTNRSSATPSEHPLYKAALSGGFETYVSPTTSDWMRLTVPAIKMGPGDSARSHMADEFVTIEEIRVGIEGYIRLIENIKF